MRSQRWKQNDERFRVEEKIIQNGESFNVDKCKFKANKAKNTEKLKTIQSQISPKSKAEKNHISFSPLDPMKDFSLEMSIPPPNGQWEQEMDDGSPERQNLGFILVGIQPSSWQGLGKPLWQNSHGTHDIVMFRVKWLYSQYTTHARAHTQTEKHTTLESAASAMVSIEEVTLLHIWKVFQEEVKGKGEGNWSFFTVSITNRKIMHWTGCIWIPIKKNISTLKRTHRGSIRKQNVCATLDWHLQGEFIFNDVSFQSHSITWFRTLEAIQGGSNLNAIGKKGGIYIWNQRVCPCMHCGYCCLEVGTQTMRQVSRDDRASGGVHVTDIHATVS